MGVCVNGSVSMGVYFFGRNGGKLVGLRKQLKVEAEVPLTPLTTNKSVPCKTVYHVKQPQPRLL